MRNEKYEDAERMFHEALEKCRLKSDKNTVIANLQILLRKLGREDEATKLSEPAHKSPYDNDQQRGTNAQYKEHERQPNSSGGSAGQGLPQGPNGASPTQLKKRDDFAEINTHIKQLDEQIKKADSSGELETLQMLFEQKADAVRLRDQYESLEYSYMLHFRAQVLLHMHRDAEAKELDAYAAQIRDRNRKQRIAPSAPPLHAPNK